MRTLARFRWLLPAAGVPICVIALGLGVQAAVFGTPSQDALATTHVIRELLRYRVMRGTETVGGRRISTVCLQGWFHSPHHRRLVRGALVLLSHDERIYDVGHGIRVYGHRGATPRGAVLRFLLAGCPRFLAESLGSRLIHGKIVDLDRTHADGSAAVAVTFGGPRAPVKLFVEPRTDEPVELTIEAHIGRGWSDLSPGGGKVYAERVKRAYRIAHHRGAPHA